MCTHVYFCIQWTITYYCSFMFNGAYRCALVYIRVHLIVYQLTVMETDNNANRHSSTQEAPDDAT